MSNNFYTINKMFDFKQKIYIFLILVSSLNLQADDLIESVFLKENTEDVITNTTHKGVKFLSKNNLFKSKDVVDFAVLIDKDIVFEKHLTLIVKSDSPSQNRAAVRVLVTSQVLPGYPDKLAFFVELSPKLFPLAVFHFSTGTKDFSIFCKK